MSSRKELASACDSIGKCLEAVRYETRHTNAASSDQLRLQQQAERQLQKALSELLSANGKIEKALRLRDKTSQAGGVN